MTDSDFDFDAYLEGSLSQQEQEAFEQALANDRALKDAFEAHKLAIAAIRMQETASLKEQMAAWEEEIPQRKPYLPYIIAAASVAALLIGVYFFLNRNPPYQEIYASYYKSYPNVVTQRGDESKHATALYMNLYDLGDFEAFARKVEEAGSTNDTLRFYQALAYMQMDEHTQAQKAFEKVAPSSAFQSAALYYQALSHIALGQKEEALAVLQTLQKNGSRSYQEKAKELSQVLTD